MYAKAETVKLETHTIQNCFLPVVVYKMICYELHDAMVNAMSTELEAEAVCVQSKR